MLPNQTLSGTDLTVTVDEQVGSGTHSHQENTILVDDRNEYADREATVVIEAGETLERDIYLEFTG